MNRRIRRKFRPAHYSVGQKARRSSCAGQAAVDAYLLSRKLGFGLQGCLRGIVEKGVRAFSLWMWGLLPHGGQGSRDESQRYTDWDHGRPETELNFKFYRQATDKVGGISDEAATFLDGFFQRDRPVRVCECRSRRPIHSLPGNGQFSGSGEFPVSRRFFRRRPELFPFRHHRADQAICGFFKDLVQGARQAHHEGHIEILDGE